MTERAEALREAAASLQTIAAAHHVGETYDSGFADGIRYAATLLAHTADDLTDEPSTTDTEGA